MSLHHVFQRVDSVMRNRPDALRWRVTMTEDAVEVFRRPVLTSAVTLGALGLSTAPMPVPQCVIRITLLDSQTISVQQVTTGCIEHAPLHMAVERVHSCIQTYQDPNDID